MLALNQVEYILLVSFAGAALVYLANFIHRLLANLLALVITGVIGFFVFTIDKTHTFTWKIGGFSIHWGINEYGWLFAVLIAVISFFAMLYSISYMAGKSRLGYYFFNLMLVVASMYGIVFSKDLLSLFFFWEIMTWSSFLLVTYGREEAGKAGVKYFIFSAMGAYAILMAVVLLYAKFKNLELAYIIAHASELGGLKLVGVSVLLLIGFTVKSALMPMHVWANDAYTEAPSSFSALFSGVLSKMGIFGVGIVLFQLLAHSPYSVYIREILAWMGGITALLATFAAVLQSDAKRLLAFSSVGQLGYIITGLAIGTELSVMAALFLTVMHGVFKAMLFWAVGAVEMRTGTTDMNTVTGLIRRMPISFLTVLMAIITVAGVPPLGGFVGKWMLYESLIISNHYILVTVIFAASTAAFLYLYRIIFSLFLGQEEPEYMNVKEAPFFSMGLPMMLLAVVTFITGIFPGVLLEPIAAAMGDLGFTNVNWKMSILMNPWGNQVDMLAVISSIGSVFFVALVYLTLRGYKNTHYASTKDIHTAGEIPAAHENLTYALDFYKPFERVIFPIAKRSADRFFAGVGRQFENLFDFVRQFYTGNGQTYAVYTMIFLVILIIFAEIIF